MSPFERCECVCTCKCVFCVLWLRHQQAKGHFFSQLCQGVSFLHKLTNALLSLKCWLLLLRHRQHPLTRSVLQALQFSALSDFVQPHDLQFLHFICIHTFVIPLCGDAPVSRRVLRPNRCCMCIKVTLLWGSNHWFILQWKVNLSSYEGWCPR